MYLDSWILAFLFANLGNLSTIKISFDRKAILIYFVYFLDYLPSLFINVKGTKSADIGNFWPKSTYLWGFYIKITKIEDDYTKSICVCSFKAVKFSKIYFQFFQILEIRNTGLKI